MRFMFTRGESSPGLPQLFRRRVKISAVGGVMQQEGDTPKLIRSSANQNTVPGASLRCAAGS